MESVYRLKVNSRQGIKNSGLSVGLKGSSEWELTDDDSFQLRRRLCDGIYELYEIEQVLPYGQGEGRRFKVAHEIIFTSEIDTDTVLSSYGYDSVEELKAIYGDDWKGVLAECEFELSAGSGEGIIRSPFLTWEEGRSLIGLLSGYEEKEPDRFLLFMSKKRFHDTGRFRFQLMETKNTVLMTDTQDGQDYPLNSGEALLNLVSEKDYPLRICGACGAPMQEGWTDDEGSTYFCCENEFREDMDTRYGRDNWRPEPSKTKEWVYEYRENPSSPWLPEPSYRTFWES